MGITIFKITKNKNYCEIKSVVFWCVLMDGTTPCYQQVVYMLFSWLRRNTSSNHRPIYTTYLFTWRSHGGSDVIPAAAATTFTQHSATDIFSLKKIHIDLILNYDLLHAFWWLYLLITMYHIPINSVLSSNPSVNGTVFIKNIWRNNSRVKKSTYLLQISVTRRIFVNKTAILF